MPHPAPTSPTVGPLLRQWRQRRRLSQLDLACDADISTRHLSCLETGRAQPSRDMLMRLAEQLAVPLRERNALLAAAGYAALYPERPLGDAAMAPVREAIDQILSGHEPYPALAVDRHWTMVSHNAMVPLLLQGVDPALLVPPVNVLRLCLHPSGLAPRIVNLGEWRAHLLKRLAQQVAATGDAVLAALREELSACQGEATHDESGLQGLVMPLRLRTPAGPVLSLISTTTVFGTPVDVTLSELALETFFPADADTRVILQAMAAG